jgi:chorismate lyase/3-hydroxybenzoate synthase
VSIQFVASKQFKLASPRWAVELAGGGEPTSRGHESFELTVHEAERASLVSFRLQDAIDLDARTFERRVADTYDCIRLELNSLRHACPVRFWNYLPAIHQPMDASRDRYMVFNAGRFAAMKKWFGQSEKSPPHYPAASGVGHEGKDLVIHCLALDQSGVMIDNPRQIPAFCYSSRYGPRPPCFARGTLIHHYTDDRPTLLAAGTASIRGEKSVHVGHLSEQIAETLENLRALLRAAGGSSGESAALSAFTDVRIYHLRPGDRAEVESAAQVAFGSEARLELIRADLCRADLLVEIEGIAPLPPGARR